MQTTINSHMFLPNAAVAAVVDPCSKTCEAGRRTEYVLALARRCAR
jgi:hypothetical protein